MIVSQDPQEHVGKTIAYIVSDAHDCLVMAYRVKIAFTDGSVILLQVDWRGDEAYISQWDGSTQETKTVKPDPGLTSEAIEESRKSWKDAFDAFKARAEVSER